MRINSTTTTTTVTKTTAIKIIVITIIQVSLRKTLLARIIIVSSGNGEVDDDRIFVINICMYE